MARGTKKHFLDLCKRKSCERTRKKIISRESLGNDCLLQRRLISKALDSIKENVPSVQQTIQNVFPYERRLEDGEFF